MLREDGDGVICIGQASHAWLSGQLARAWGNDAFPRPEPWEEIVLAALQHDIGMAEWDLAPGLNRATGWPLSFMEMPLKVHLSLWSQAAAKVVTQSRYAALLVSMHGTWLYERRDLDSLPAADRRRVEEFLAGQRTLQERLLGSLGMDLEAVTPARRLVSNWDSLSLALCVPWRSRMLSGVPGAGGAVDIAVSEAGDRRWQVAPWPFAAGSVEVCCEGRRLEGRFETEPALRAALAQAPVEMLRFTLTPDG